MRKWGREWERDREWERQRERQERDRRRQERGRQRKTDGERDRQMEREGERNRDHWQCNLFLCSLWNENKKLLFPLHVSHTHTKCTHTQSVPEHVLTISFFGAMVASLAAEAMPVRLAVWAISVCRRSSWAWKHTAPQVNLNAAPATHHSTHPTPFSKFLCYPLENKAGFGPVMTSPWLIFHNLQLLQGRRVSTVFCVCCYCKFDSFP